MQIPSRRTHSASPKKTSRRRSFRKNSLSTPSRRRFTPLAVETLEDRRLLAITAAIPPAITDALSFLLSVTPDNVRDAIPNEITQFPGTTLAYQALPQEVNDVSVKGNSFNFLLLLNEGGSNVSNFRVGPAITKELIEQIKAGVVDIVGDVEFPLSDLVGFDLPNSSAIVPNPQAIVQFFPFFGAIADGINAFLDFGIPDITFPEVNFPELEIPGFGPFCPCEIIPSFTLIPEFTLFPGFTLSDVLPDEVVDIVRGIASFVEDFSPGGVYVNTLDGDDNIDLSHLTGVQQALFGGTGNDTILPGGGEQINESLGLIAIPGVIQPSINAFGNSGRDTIVVNRRFDVDDFNVDGGAGNDILLIDASGGNDIIELSFDPDGTLTEVKFLAPNPRAGVQTNARQRLKLPAETTGGTFTLTFDDGNSVATTNDILYSASFTDVQNELAALPNIGTGNVSVAKPSTGTWEIEFINALAGAAQPKLIPDGTNLVTRGGGVTVVRTDSGDPSRGTNEIQRITPPTNPDGSRFITGGTFTLTYTGNAGAETTAPIRYNASPSQVQSALEALPSIQPGDIRSVGVPGGPWLVEFRGSLALTPQQELTAEGSLLTGGVSPTISQINASPRVQTVTLPGPKGTNTSVAGTFALSYNNGSISDTTVPIPAGATAAFIQSALGNLASIGTENVSVTGSAGGPWNVAFTGQPGLRGQPLITALADQLTGGVTLDIQESVPGSGTNEVQRILSPVATGGTFQLTFNNGSIARTTVDVPFDATVGEIQLALESLTSIGGSGNVIVSNTDGGPWDVEFTGTLAAAEQIELAVDGSNLVFDIQPPAASEFQPGGGGQNEIQRLSRPRATGGTFTVTFDDGTTARTTAGIPFDATLGQMTAALESLSNIGAGSVRVTGTDGGPWDIEFIGGGLQDTNLLLMTVDGTALTGLPVVEELIGHVPGANEQQTIATTPAATAGQFTLSFGGETTASLTYDATAAEVQAALEHLASIQVGEVQVTSANARGGPWSVEFTGRMAATDQPLITGDSSSLAGGFNASEIVVAQDPNHLGDNEFQTITMPAAPLDAQAGTFRLTFNGRSTTRTTGDIQFNATAQQVEDALADLDNIGTGNVDVTSPNTRGGPWTIEFTQNLAATDVPLITINSTQLSRNDPIEVIEVLAAAPTNELQTVTLPAMTTGGSFTLQFDDGTTPLTTTPIPFNAPPTAVQAILESLSNINPGDVQVTGGINDPSVVESVAGSPLNNELQTIEISPLALGGTFTLTFDDGTTSETTGPIDFNAPKDAVQSALEQLSNIGSGNVSVDGGGGAPYEVEFIGTLQKTDQPLLAADGTNLTQLENSPWKIEFVGRFAAAPQLPLVADGSQLQITGLDPSLSVLAQGSQGDPILLKTTHFTDITSIEQLQINGNGGDDTVIVRGAPNFPLGVLYEGGDGIDSLQLISTSAQPSFVSPVFPDSSQGSLTMDNRLIQIGGVEGDVELNAGGQVGTIVFSGTNEANDMRFAGTSADTATLVTDGQVTTTLTGFAAGSTLTIRGEQGDDVISVAPNAFTRFSNVFVFGGGPSGADTVRFEGTPDDDAFMHTPNSANAKSGVVEINTVVTTYDNVEAIQIEGLEGADALTLNEPQADSSDNVLFNPAAANDGSYTLISQVTPADPVISYSPVAFGSIETRSFSMGTGSDTVTASTDDLPGVNSSVEAIGGNGTTTVIFGDQATDFNHDAAGDDLLSLEIGTTVDDVTVTPGAQIEIAVNTSLGSDTLIYQAQAGPVALNLAESRIQQPTLGDVTFTSAEQLVISGNGQNDLNIVGLDSENRFYYTPRAATGGFVTLDQVLSSVTFDQIGGQFTLTGGVAVGDQVMVVGSNNEDAFAVDPGARTVRTIEASGAELKTVQLAGNIEVVGVDAGPGDDLIRVEVADALDSAPQVRVDGGIPDASDRLIVVDGGIGNLTLHREGPIERSGSVTVGGGPAVSYENVEKVDILPLDPVTGGTGSDGQGQVVVFDTDPFEQNDNRQTPTIFEDLAESTVRPNIDPAARTDPFGFEIPGDEDWYRFVAPRTATLQFSLVFDAVPELANGQPGLPHDGELRIDVYDANGAPIARLGGEGVSSHTVGVEIDQVYFLRVRGATPDAINVYDLDVLNLDEIGPQITDVYVTSQPAYDLFDPKPVEGPTPLVDSITIRIQDPVARRPGFLYEALNQVIAQSVGHYRVVGDHNGVIAISDVTVVNDPRVAGQLATASVILSFSEPLPEDRFTLTVFDNLVDPVGNRLDGESNAIEPQETPFFPTGDGTPGGNFLARFTVDSRAEIGVWAAGSVYVDTNGNFQFDPENPDDTNEDISYVLGFTSDNVFAGNFVAPGEQAADGFDKLAAFGLLGGSFRWLIDTDNDGVPNLVLNDPVAVNGLPTAGNFDGNAANGDEVVLHNGQRWYFDTDHNFQLDLSIPTSMIGLPFAGDFDGDGNEDLGVWRDDTFFLDLSSVGPSANAALPGLSGNADREFRFGFPGVRERPVAGDLDGDGIDDLGLWVPDRSGAVPSETAEWYFLVSGGRSIDSRIVPDSQLGGNVVDFTPVPFGQDVFAQFGDDFALPVVGNFDPPVVGGDPPEYEFLSFTNAAAPLDVSGDTLVTPIDALLVINELNANGPHQLPRIRTEAPPIAPFLDASGDFAITPLDALLVINRLNQRAGGEGEADRIDAPLIGSLDSLASVPQTRASAAPANSAPLAGATVTSSTDLALLTLIGEQQRTAPVEALSVVERENLTALLDYLSEDVSSAWNGVSDEGVDA